MLRFQIHYEWLVQNLCIQLNGILMKKTKFKSLVGVDSDLLFEKKLKEIYITKPISIEKKIPIFSKNDVYIDNLPQRRF